ncbi:MAG: 3'-5' exonuclease [Flavobacterium nitrogenifigens]|uniref:DNA polymerase-3 subunit epsilon n=1 Tax=Flavobacterium nitrogenifigens TaxID=1617283 RepID=A0A521BPQ8_9FLAO|nr:MULTISPECIES: 3'-5' exonuclease [Flavobacterium]KAF2080879.1 3'-5' exonuclease [Flavobacterium sharifuzzamanii]KAF2330769.1 3'-5' exonuclease [Flavobacterium nitrogenifigens]MDQ8015028.1 3'-5' exonuclease [Flavobacterium nitrogenifigens]WDF65648.1 3'-5' exonuclease [Flavobacterium sp. KACC 22763]SMO49134.1 DNA polymerase-3 subunit epsilon [Flavobacterium nitrogenifigens]
MLDWLKNINKDYPDFWKDYLTKFETKPNKFVVLSTETSGLNPDKDVVLSLGAFSVIDDSIVIKENFETVLLQYKYLQDNGLSNEFIIESKMMKMPEPDALEAFVNFIGNSILVGHHINFDIEMLNAALERLNCGRLKNEALDVDVMYRKLTDINDKQFSLDDLCGIYKIPKSDRNSSSEDAYRIGLLFLKLKSRLGIK